MNDDTSEPSSSSRPLPCIISDTPEESKTPQFRFDEYAQSIADVIGNPENKTPLVIGLYGAWGSGKTTLMKRVEHYLKPKQKKPEYRTCKTVWFQAWKHAGEEAILAGLIEEIFNSMGSQGVFSWTKAGMEKLAEQFNVKALFDDVIKGITGGVIDPEKWFSSLEYKSKLGFYPVFDRFFERLLWSYVTPSGLQTCDDFDDKKGVLVVFIDDLDRCPNDRIVKVLETIKLFMDKPGCVFVMGADREVIEKALEDTYPKASQQFMDKIVQVTFALPPVPTPDIQQFLIDHAPEQQAMMEKFAPLIARVLGHNIRAVKRFLNNMRLAESLVVSVGGDLSHHPHALMRWSIVEYVYPDLAKMIRGNVASVPVMVEKITALEEKLSGGEWTLTKEVAKDLVIPDSLVEWLQDKQVVELVTGFPTEPRVLEALISLSAATESSEESREQEMTRGSRGAGPVDDKMVEIPSGPFLYGEDNAEKDISNAFEIDTYPVTNEQFRAFVDDKGYSKEEYWSDEGREWKEREQVTEPRFWTDDKWNTSDHPVVGVTWFEADAFARWAGKRLLTEEEWEKAARGAHGNAYPWGDEFDSAKCNGRKSGGEGTSPVTKYVNGLSPYGCYDMAGNVWEWMNSWKGKDLRVLRGGSWLVEAEILRSSVRYWNSPSARDNYVGFRCARTPR